MVGFSVVGLGRWKSKSVIGWIYEVIDRLEDIPRD